MDVPLDSVRPNEDAFFMGHRAAPHGRGGEKVQVAVPRGLRKLCKLGFLGRAIAREEYQETSCCQELCGLLSRNER
jgi:hypothetical protein